MPPIARRLSSHRTRPPKRTFPAVLVALAAVPLLAGLASCGGQTSQKTSHGDPAPATTPSTPSPPTSTPPTSPPPMSAPPTSAPSTAPDGGGASPSEPGARSGGAGLDPRFATCAKANAAGYGPYYRGADPEYAWYEDRDQDGIDCEPRDGTESSTPVPSPSGEPSSSTSSEEPSAPGPSEMPSDSGPGEGPSGPASSGGP